MIIAVRYLIWLWSEGGREREREREREGGGEREGERERFVGSCMSHALGVEGGNILMGAAFFKDKTRQLLLTLKSIHTTHKVTSYTHTHTQTDISLLGSANRG